MGKTVRGAVIGYGGAFNMGRKHAEEMMKFGISFVAACDQDPARMEQASKDFPDIRTYTKVEELLAQTDIDLITVITPHNTHVLLAEQILISGKHCILEKPMSIHAEDAEMLVRLSKKKGKMLSVYHNRRWDDWYLTLKDLIDKGLIGEIFHVEMFSGNHSRPGTWWRSDKAISGGVFYDWGAHFVDYLLGVVPGKVTSVKGFIHNLVWHDVSNEDHIDSIISFESGAMAHIQISTIAHAGKATFRILGTEGAIVDENMSDGELKLFTKVKGIKMETKVKCLPSRQEAYYENIADHLMNGAELIVKPEEARRTIAIIETTEQSALAGKGLPGPYE